MINFEEEIKKFEPSLEVSKLEDAIIQSEMSDFNDIIMGILKKEKKFETVRTENVEQEQNSDEENIEFHLDQTEFPEGEYAEEPFTNGIHVPNVYDTKHDQ